jgi:hypothetical protein
MNPIQTEQQMIQAPIQTKSSSYGEPMNPTMYSSTMKSTQFQNIQPSMQLSMQQPLRSEQSSSMLHESQHIH